MNCNICNQETERFKHEKTNITYHHCESCEYIFKSPEYYQDFEQQKERYNLHENDEDDAGYIAYFQRFLNFILPLDGRVENALDFGCGRTSLLAKLLEKEGIKCDYYDPIYHPDTLEPYKQYDLIVSTEVFEHLHQPREIFKDLLSRLHSGGYLAIQTEFHSNEVESFKKWWYQKDPTHIIFFRVKTFAVLCKMYGCKVIKNNGKNMLLIEKL